MSPHIPSTPSPRRAYVGAVVLLAAAAFVIWFAVDQQSESALELVAPHGRLLVEVAQTPEARAKGLSNRAGVRHDGLLLLWDTPGRHPIWMANMRFALDIVWLDEHGRVLALLTGVPQCASTPCPMYEPPGTENSTSVLELPAGSAARHGIEIGSVVRRSSAR
jgi:uncharacterized membrane protein (UPF0127 family)